jgi:hypothetical protein
MTTETKSRTPQPQRRVPPNADNMRELSDARARTVQGILKRNRKTRGRSD